MTISADDKARFEEDGYLVVPGLLDAEEVDILRAAMAGNAAIDDNVVRLLDDRGGVTELALWNHPGDDAWGATARCARVVDTMEALLEDEVYHYHSKLNMKAPRSGGAWNWHQDYGYWYQNGCLFPDLASVMIAIDPADRENGCLQVLRGSHRAGRIEHLMVGGQTSADPARVEALEKHLEVVPCEMGPGDALFFHCNTLHTSDQNRSDRPRSVLIIAYNTRHNDPVKAHHHPFYTPLEKLPDDAIKRRAGTNDTNRRFMRGEDDDTSGHVET